MGWKNAKWLILDTETTGLHVSGGARVWEVGWARIENMNVVDSGDWVLDPGEMDDKAQNVLTTISHQDPNELKGKPDFKSMVHELAELMKAADFYMAYNAKFDKAMLENEFKLAGETMPTKDWLDPMIWVQKFIQAGNHKLVTMTEHFKIKLEHAHRANYDAEAAARVAIEFIKSLEGKVLPEDPAELMDKQERWKTEIKSANASKHAKHIESDTPPKDETGDPGPAPGSMKRVFPNV